MKEPRKPSRLPGLFLSAVADDEAVDEFQDGGGAVRQMDGDVIEQLVTGHGVSSYIERMFEYILTRELSVCGDIYHGIMISPSTGMNKKADRTLNIQFVENICCKNSKEV